MLYDRIDFAPVRGRRVSRKNSRHGTDATSMTPFAAASSTKLDNGCQDCTKEAVGGDSLIRSRNPKSIIQPAQM